MMRRYFAAIAIVATVVAVGLWAAFFSNNESEHFHYEGPRSMTIPGGYRVSFSELPKAPAWGFLQVQLSEDYSGLVVAWNNLTNASLTSHHPPATWHYGSAKALGNLSVWYNVTDVKGDGKLGAGDYFDFTTGGARFSASSTYSLTIVYTPTGSAMMSGCTVWW